MPYRRLPGAAVWLACMGLSIAMALSLPGAGSTTAAQEIEIPRVPNPPLDTDLANLPGDLRAIAVPGPSNLDEFVKNADVARALGKALFWDMNVGSDNVQACASCHFRAGADPRSKNQLSPGLKNVPLADLSFSHGRGPNTQLLPVDFPLTRLAIPETRGVLDEANDSNDAVASQGVHHLGAGPDPEGFAVGAIKTRRVEPRNTPTVINAVFNHRQFWDGRAENIFNGVNHVGARDPGAQVYRADDPANPIPVSIALVNSSLASQAVAPIVSALEMSAPGSTPQDIGRDLTRGHRLAFARLRNLRPLARQQVHPTDSILGPWSRYPLRGLSVLTYDAMIRQAFHDHWWRSSRLIRVNADGSTVVVDGADQDDSTDEYTLIQYNFALFFGIAVQMYETTLVADDTPWDRFRRQHPGASDPALNPWVNTNPDHISRLALFGAHLFNDRTRGPSNLRCSNCHEQAELTDASVGRVSSAAKGPVRNRDGNVIDKGFNNIGIRPTGNDPGVGGSDAFGPLSHAKRLFPGALPATFDGTAVSKGFGIEGAFKVPSLRNVALTAPYFHNGEARTLREVVELYSRGGNVWPVVQTDGTPIEPLGLPTLTPAEMDALVVFMEALTDERVLYRRAPFDHPQLFVPNGHRGNANVVLDLDLDGFGDDLMIEIPAVGAAGGPPLPGFLAGIFGPQ